MLYINNSKVKLKKKKKNRLRKKMMSVIYRKRQPPSSVSNTLPPNLGQGATPNQEIQSLQCLSGGGGIFLCYRTMNTLFSA